MTESFWMKRNTKTTNYPTLQKETDAHIAIIGGGLTGITTAYYLAQAEEDAILLEADSLCFGASGRNTGKLTMQHGLLYANLIEHYDRILARQYYEANEEALNSIEAIIQEHHIACSFERCDSMLFTRDAVQVAKLQEEYQAYLDLHIPCTYICHRHAGGGAGLSSDSQRYVRTCGYRNLRNAVSVYRSGTLLFYAYVL